MENRTKLLGILLIILLIIFVILIIFNILNKETNEKKAYNKEIQKVDISELMRCARGTLNSSENLEINSITDESMVKFAVKYMAGYNTKYHDNMIIVELKPLEETVQYIFDRKINFEKINFKHDNEYVYIPDYPISTDVQIYKFNRNEYDEKNDWYIIYIDCLEATPSRLQELDNYKVIDYTADEVISTLVFKYRVKEDRKILLSYKQIINI